MKNKKSTCGKILLLFMLTISTLIFGQDLKSTNTKKSEGINCILPCELISFTIKTMNGKNYINWFAKSSSDNYYFILEKSFDGKNYLAIYTTKNFISPLGQKLQYSFIDEKSTSSEKTYYRITLHKIDSINVESKSIFLSKQNMWEKNNNSTIIILEPQKEVMAKYSK